MTTPSKRFPHGTFALPPLAGEGNGMGAGARKIPEVISRALTTPSQRLPHGTFALPPLAGEGNGMGVCVRSLAGEP